jgi:hypothetical protein
MNESKNVLQQVFRRSQVFLPVVHPVTKETALQSIDTAVRSRADGIFLINQGMSNVNGFLPYVDAYLVASAIETAEYSGVLIPERTKLLAEGIHGWDRKGKERHHAGYMS